MVTLAVAAVLLTVALPSFLNLVRDHRMRIAVDDLIVDLAYARSEAIKRVAPVVLCTSADRKSCEASARWSDGWLIYVDDNRDHALESGESVLAAREKLPGELQVDSSNFANYIAYLPDGSSNVPGHFLFADARGNAAATTVCVAATGRVRVVQSASC